MEAIYDTDMRAFGRLPATRRCRQHLLACLLNAGHWTVGPYSSTGKLSEPDDRKGCFIGSAQLGQQQWTTLRSGLFIFSFLLVHSVRSCLVIEGMCRGVGERQYGGWR